MKTKIIGGYSIFLGIVVFGMWAMMLLKNEIPEGFTKVIFQLLAELTMAVLCIVSGNKLIKKKSNAVNLNLLGLGMAVYSILIAAGYYGQKGDGILMLLFLALFVSTVVCILLQFLARIS